MPLDMPDMNPCSEILGITMDEAVNRVVQKMVTDYLDSTGSREMKIRFVKSIKVEQLQKWVRITADGSVKMFIVTAPNVESTSGRLFEIGDMLKPASYKAPAKNFARGNVFRSDCLKRVRWLGVI